MNVPNPLVLFVRTLDRIAMKLIFIYNADSGRLNALFDIGHKILSPRTYQCSLCKLAFGAFSETNAWKQFRERSSVEMVFQHRDEFEQEYGKQFEYPVVLAQNGELEVLLSKAAIDACEDVYQLIQAVEDRISNP